MHRCWCGNEKLIEYSEHYMKCEECHTLISKVDFTDAIYEIEDEETNLYGDNYWKKVMLELTGQTSLSGVIDCYLNDRVIYWLKYIMRYIPAGSKVAEIGCGVGQLSYAMKELTYQQTGYELSPEICKYIEETLHVPMVCGQFQDSKEQYDAVIAIDLVEHLIDAKGMLRDICDKLDDKGVLCVQMPRYDEKLSYEQMLEQKPRFQDLLTEEQHVYLYSIDSATRILKEAGFTYIEFEPACFGDDYDMFLFASKSPLQKSSDEEFDAMLNSIPNGRIVKALISLYDQKQELLRMEARINAERDKQLADLEELTKQVHDKDSLLEQKDKQVEELNTMLRGKDQEILQQMEYGKIKDGSIAELNDRLEKEMLERRENLTQLSQVNERLSQANEQLAIERNDKEQIIQARDLLLEEKAALEGQKFFRAMKKIHLIK